MEGVANSRKVWVLAPFLLPIYSILFIFAGNMDQVSWQSVILPCLISLAVSISLWFFLKRMLGESERAGIILFMLLFIFFSYGHFYVAMTTLEKKLALDIQIARFRYIFLLYALIFAPLIYLTIRTKRRLFYVHHFLNSLCVLLLLFLAFQILVYVAGSHRATKDAPVLARTDAQIKDLPDIYYIVLDGYAGFRTLKEVYGFDNSAIHGFLKEKGFFVADSSHSNYAWTHLSLSSSLNMGYINNLSTSVGRESNDRTVPISMIKNSIVARILKSSGYRFTNFSSGWEGTDYIKMADQNIGFFGNLNEFNQILVRTTALRSLERFYTLRDRILGAFENLERKSKEKGPKFVLAHIPAPHPHFVFGANGEKIDVTSEDPNDWSDRARYLDEVRFLNQRLIRLVDAILSNSKSRPVIIIQSDHGPASSLSHPGKEPDGWIDPPASAMKERTDIINAYLITDRCKKDLYEGITPVNSFRVVFNCYFGTNYGRLPDKTYWSISYRPYALKEITDIVLHD